MPTQDLTKYVVFRESIKDPGGSYQVTHGSRHGGRVDTDCHQGRTDIDVLQETVVSLEKVTRDERYDCKYENTKIVNQS